MTDAEYEAWLASLTLVGDEAFMPGEPIPREVVDRGGLSTRDPRAYKRIWHAEQMRTNPAYRARRQREYLRRQERKRAAA
jgi:hypothetical protein